MRFLISRRGFLVVVAVLAALFVIRPGAGGLKVRISRSIGDALGRQVQIGRVSIHLLPRPGFDLKNFTILDDPAYGAEPMLRAPEVSATLRLGSLLRGRLGISSLALTEPSLNLVRNSDGHWNIENVLERTAHISVAPTGKTVPESRPAFPYIEADHGRINFKFGQEKKPYALVDADFALWQDSENAWAMRLKAQPLRADFNVSDTGLVKMSGTWQRAATLRETPLQFNLQWEGAQLGQLSKLLSGADKGWRGTLTAAVTLTGNPADLSLTATSSVQDFHRYDIIAGDSLRLAAHCIGRYRAADHTLRGIICGGPVGDGMVTVQGDLAGIIGSPSYDLKLSAERVPIQAVVALVRHAKKGLPQDLVASGNLDANVTISRSDQPGDHPQIAGKGQTSELRLTSAVTGTELDLGSIPVSIVFPSGEPPGRKPSPYQFSEPASSGPQVDIGPLDLPLGRPTPALVRGWFGPSGFSLSLTGEAQVQHLLMVARTLGIPALQPPAEGMAKLNLQIGGPWSGFAAPNVVGTAQLHAVRAEIRGLNSPLEINSANLFLADNDVEIQNLTASAGNARWNGSLSLPRHCNSPAECPIVFDLHTSQFDVEEANALFNPEAGKRPWYHRLYLSSPGPSILAAMQASGRVTAARALVGNFTARNVSARVELQSGKLQISDLYAEFLGGRHRGEWQADFTVKPRAYAGSGSLERVTLSQLSQAMGDKWITGTATAQYHLSMSGNDKAQLLDSAEGTLQFDMRDGTLPHVTLASRSSSLQVHRFRGHMILRQGQLQFEQAKLEVPSGSYEVTGTASLGRKLNLSLGRNGAPAFAILGTLGAPRIVSRPETQAALHP